MISQRTIFELTNKRRIVPRKKTNSNTAMASGASQATANIKNRSGNPTTNTKGKGKALASKSPTGITKKSNLRQPAARSTHRMATRSKKAVRFADMADIAYFAPNSIVPTGVPPPPPPPPKTNKVVYYLEKDQMDVLRDHRDLTENPEEFDWRWVSAHMKRLPPGKRGPRGCIKLVISVPDELNFLLLPQEIKLVDTKMHEEEEQDEQQDEDQEEEEGLESPPPIDNFDS
jgi:hypothetical protein